MASHKIAHELFNGEVQMRDPANAGTITVDRSPAYIPLTSLGTETRTLAAPTKPGAIAILAMRVDAGDITVTVTGGYNEDGDTTFVFTDPGQFAVFISCEIAASTYAWRKITDYGIGNIAPADSAVLSILSGLVATAAEINRVADMDTRIVPITSGSSATLAITAADHDGKTIYVTKTDGWNATLPVPVAGMRFRIVIGATITVASTIKSTAGTQIMIGHATMGNDTNTTTVDFQSPAASTFDTINLLGTGNSTGGMEGQVIEIEAMSTTVWFVEIQGDAAGGEATPFENTVA